MRATPTVQKNVSPRVASSPYVPTDCPHVYKVILLAAIRI